MVRHLIRNGLRVILDDRVDHESALRLGLSYLVQKFNRRQGQTAQVLTTDSLLAAD